MSKSLDFLKKRHLSGDYDDITESRSGDYNSSFYVAISRLMDEYAEKCVHEAGKRGKK